MEPRTEENNATRESTKWATPAGSAGAAGGSLASSRGKVNGKAL